MDELDYITGAVKDARDILSMECDAAVSELADDLYRAGLAAWQLDPEVESVIGLMNLTDSNRNAAWLVVYLKDRDVECSEAFHARLDAL